MREATRGILALVGACTVWGLSPLFYRALAGVPPLELLAWRCLWSLAFFAVILAGQRGIGDLGALIARRDLRWRIVIAAVMVSANWFGYVLAVASGQVTQSALGYFIFPLAAVALGRLVLGEGLSPVQWVAVGLAAGGVVLMALGAGAVPWLALYLAVTFAVYGLVKKRLPAGPVLSVTAEVALVAPFALAVVLLAGGGHDLRTHLLLMLSGPLTAGPLILFAYAARRVRMAALGLGQYINPTLQFLVAALVFAEPLTALHLGAFGLIWAGLSLYSAAALRQDSAAASAESSAPASGTTVR